MNVDPSIWQPLLARAEAVLARLEAIVPRPLEAPDWNASTAFRYRKRGDAGRLEPVRHVATIRLDALVEVGPQKERLLRNTEQFVAGRAANNVLLTGARGTGKSSLIKACLNEFASRGLRLIEVDKTDLVDLPDIVANLNAGRRAAFIKLKAKFELSKPEDAAAIQAAMPRIIDLFQSYLREMRPEELRGTAGTYRLREELIARTNIAAHPARVLNVLFTELLVQ